MSASRDGAAMDDGSEGAMDGTSTRGTEIADAKERPIMQAQVVLDRQGFGPGVIDGKMGASTRNALEGFQEANDLEVTGELDEETKQALDEWSNIPATRVVTIPASWGEMAFRDIPDDPAKQAEMERMGYESLDEKIAERFHTTAAVLKELNPNGKPAGATGAMASSSATPSASASATPTPTPTPTGTASASASASKASDSFFTAGQQIRVPNIGADMIKPGSIQDKGWQQTLASLGVGTEQPKVARIVVDESEGWLKGYDADDNLVAMFTVTTGSTNDPLPVGEWGITGVGRNPPFSYQPDLFWDVPDDEEEQQLPPGPNGPVGVVWIDLTKEHYGIHGTSAPETIGRVQSHGCVRLTNWDAARLAGMVSTNTVVIFQA
ncbi:L,D-transpeptidase family protein [Erythrobacter sp. GH3-10]|uniref:L,D-transpeptidase family protein n=2 Tax=Aurantiacibacter rhizosphaerae TaxID=2691582 RepID=A0A844XCC7_9SPHN|nr:L,D-transpeptidase family protein [Aurantiacibacter rhizosphaerae]